jgi:WD40 repeat protein
MTLTLKGGHANWVLSVAFSPDGQRLASSNANGNVNVWDAQPWTPELKAEQQAVSLIRFLFGKGLSKADVLQSIATDETINDLVRHRATELARDWK